MPVLQKCSALHGNVFYSFVNPLAAAFDEAIVFPRNSLISYDSDAHWGVYESNGTNISLAAYRRGPYQDRVGQSQWIEPIANTRIEENGLTYIYIGPQIMHHGHFLLTSLARIWPLLKLSDRNIRLVYHGDQDIETICRHIPIADATLKAFQLTSEHFLRPMEPTTFQRLYIPAPSFEETNSAYRVHSDLGAAVGQHLKIGHTSRVFTNPVMFSKTKLASGVGRFTNEDEITDYLSRKGVDIIYPEQLSLAEQVDVFETAPAIISYAGSALHTSLLASKPATIIGLNLGNTMGSSQILIDALKRNDSTYFYPSQARETSPVETFSAALRVDDPIAVADTLLREIDAKISWRTRLKRLGRKPDPLKMLSYPGVQSLWP